MTIIVFLFRIVSMEEKHVKTIKLIIVNLFTIIRLLGAFSLPFIFIEYGVNICALWCIGLFSTDAIDGFLARTFKVSTFFGSSMDALSDKCLNFISYILLGINYNIMFAPLILEIAILLTIYNTYRQGGNIQSSKIGKIKTVILDVLVILSFILLSLPNFNIKYSFILKIIKETPDLINLFGCIITIASILALLSYKKKNLIERVNPNNVKIKNTIRVRKTFKEVMHDAFDTEYYKKNKDEPIMKQFYKNIKVKQTA